MKETSTGIRHFLAAFRYSMAGFRTAVRESAVRQELVLGAASYTALWFVPFPAAVKLLLGTLWVLVLVTELLNTSVEAVVDLASPDWHELAKRAKDLGSAAVFAMLVVFFGAWAYALVKYL